MVKTLYDNLIAIWISKRLHIICWAAFIFYEVVITGVLLGHFSPFLSYLLFYAINILLFYVHAIRVLPFALLDPSKSWWRVPFTLIIELLIYFILIASTEKLVYFTKGMPAQPINWRFAAATIWRGIYFMLYGTGYYFLINFIRNQRRINQEAIQRERLTSQLLRTEKDFLRAQINPHLLFNTLNFVKYAAKRKPDDVEVCIETLAELMNFAMEENDSEYLTLATELRQIKNVIKINQLRYEGRLNLDFIADVHDENIPVIPIVLLTLIENIFKHGDLLKATNPAVVHIVTTHDYLSFHSSNLPSFSLPVGTRNKKGLKNIEFRLETYYPGKYKFTYGMKDNLFVADLLIHLR